MPEPAPPNRPPGRVPPPDVYRVLVENAADLLSTHSRDGAFTFVTPALAELLGRREDELIGVLPVAFAHPLDVRLIAQAHVDALHRKGVTRATWRCRRGDGAYVWLETTARAVVDPATGGVTQIVCSTRDVNTRQQIEEALRESEHRLRSIIEAPNLVAVGLDTSGHITFCNDALCTLTGWARDELIGKSWFETLSVDPHEGRATLERVLRGGDGPFIAERELLLRDGHRRLITWETSTLRDPLGAIAGTVSLGADVTERRQEEEALQLLQHVTLAVSNAVDVRSALQLTLESVCEATGWEYGEAWVPDPTDQFLIREGEGYSVPGRDFSTMASSAWMTHVRGDGVAGHTWASGTILDIPDLGANPAFRRAPAAAAAGLRAAVGVPVRAGDDVVAVLVFCMSHRRPSDEYHTRVVSVMTNQLGALIVRKRAESALRDSEQRLRTVVQSMDEGLVITDTNDHIVFVNRRMLELLGYTEEEMLGRLTPDMLMPEADRERFAARMARRRAGIAERYDVMLQRRDGTNVWAEVSGVPLQNASGEFIGTLGTYTDITQRRAHQEELVRARDEAQAANRAKTDFLSRMSHELRTPLNSVIGFANVLRRNRRAHLDAEEMNYLERILSNGRHLLALVNNVLDIAKVEAGRLSVEVEQVDVAALVRDVVEQLAGQPRAEGVELRAEIPEGVDPLPSDPFLLRQVLINLTANALKFTQAGHVAVTLRVDPATHLPARIDVEDTGVGIAPDRLAAIFEPFEQEEKFTNRYFGGTGLGLSISKAICDALGFQLEVTSEKGRGSVFSVVMEPPPSPDT